MGLLQTILNPLEFLKEKKIEGLFSQLIVYPLCQLAREIGGKDFLMSLKIFMFQESSPDTFTAVRLSEITVHSYCFLAWCASHFCVSASCLLVFPLHLCTFYVYGDFLRKRAGTLVHLGFCIA